jgi:hypothetical protein
MATPFSAATAYQSPDSGTSTSPTVLLTRSKHMSPCKQLTQSFHLLLRQLFWPTPSYRQTPSPTVSPMSTLYCSFQPYQRGVITFLDVTTEQVRRYPSQSSVIIKGHLDKQHANLRSKRHRLHRQTHRLRPDHFRKRNRTLSSADGTASPTLPSPIRRLPTSPWSNLHRPNRPFSHALDFR